MSEQQWHMCGTGRQRRPSGIPRSKCVPCSARDRNAEAEQQRMAETHIQVCYQCHTVWAGSPCGCGGRVAVWQKKSPELAREHYAEQARQAAKFNDGEEVKVDGDGIIVLEKDMEF